MTDLNALVSPDDHGSDTFARYKYQAHVTFPYVLELATGETITDLFAEHVEDIAVRKSGTWCFLQVKSQNAKRGPWSLSDVVQSGAFHSLWRAYQTASSSVDATYEICVEGALRKDDPLQRLADREDLDDDALTRVAAACGVAVEDVRPFAARLQLRFLLPLEAVAAQNIGLMIRQAPEVAAGDIEKTYHAAVAAIEAAMTANRLEGDWPAALFLTRDERMQARLARKRITRERAQDLLAPILRAASSSPAVQPSRAPFVLPQRDEPTFTGRAAELKRLEDILLREDGEKVGCIAGLSGTGGLGKTALACHFAEIHRSAFSGGVIGLRVDGKEPITIAREFVRSAWVELDPEDERDASTLMQEVFRDRRALLIFDNTRDGSIRALLPGGKRCAVIITTRDRLLPVTLGLPDEARLDVTPLAEVEAMRLFATLLPDLAAAEADAAIRICALVGNLPLAIQIVGAILAMQSWRSLADFETELREEKERLALLSVSGDSALDLRVSFSLSLDLLGSNDAEFFACLGVCAADGFSVIAAAAAAGCDDRSAQRRLAALFRLSLINRRAGASMFVLHPLLRLFAREYGQSLGVLDAAESRHRDFFRAMVMRHDPDDPEVATLLDGEVDDILAAAESLEGAGALDSEFLNRVEPLFKQHGYWLNKFGGLLLRQNEPRDAEPSRRGTDERETSGQVGLGDLQSLRMEAELLQRTGDLDGAAHALRKAAALASSLGSRGLEAVTLHDLGGVLQMQGNSDQAVEAFRRSSEIFFEVGDSRGQAMVLNSLGGALQRQGKFDEAAGAFRSTSEAETALHNRRGQAMALNSLGGVLQRQGKFDEAVDAFRRSYELFLALDDSRGQAMVLNSLGGVLQRQGKFDEAVDALRRSYDREFELANVHGQVMVLNSLGGVFQRQGKFDEAVDAFRRSYAISEELDDHRSLAMVLNSLGGVLQRQGKFDEAVDAFRRSHVISEELGDRRSLAMVLNSLGGVLQRQGELDEAADMFRRSYELLLDLGDPRGQAMVLNSLGGVLQRQVKFDEAVDTFRKSNAISEELGDDRSLAMVQNSLGGVLQRQGKLEESFEAFRASISIGEKLRDRRHLAMVHTSFGRALLRVDKNAAVRELRKGFALDAELHNRKGIGIVGPMLVETLLKLGRVEEAAEICDRALAIVPGDQRLLRLKDEIGRRLQ